MAGIKTLQKIQLGQETTAGTAVAATQIWRGNGAIEDRRETMFIDESVGYMQRTSRTCVPKLLGAVTMDPIPATFEQLPYILTAGVEAVVDGVVDTDGSGYVYSYDWPTTEANSLTTFTIEAGDNQQAQEVEYAFVESFNLSGRVGEPLMMSAEWLGRQVSTCSFTADISMPTVEEILVSKTKIYIDTPANIGDTIKSNTLLAIDLNAKTGVVPLFAADGALYFSATKTVAADVTVDLTFEHDSTSVAEIAAWKAETERGLKILLEGSALTTAGDDYTYKTLNIVLYGKWASFGKIGEQDGNDIVTGKFNATYVESKSKFGAITVVNEDSSLT